MSNPQQELFKMLAESNLRIDHMQQMHGRSIQGARSKQDAILAQLAQLRGHIQQVGLGSDPEAEAQYLQLLEHQRILDQSITMHQQQEPDPAPEAIPSDLQKAIDYGRMLLDIYQGGALVKGASVDIEAIAQRLENLPYTEAKDIASRLYNLQ